MPKIPSPVSLIPYVHVQEDDNYDPASCTYCDLRIAHTDAQHDDEVSVNFRQAINNLVVTAEEE